MSVTNEIKKIREKLEVFDTPRFNQVITDLMNYNYDANKDYKMTPGELVMNLKAHYKRQLDQLLEKQGKFKQTKLKF